MMPCAATKFSRLCGLIDRHLRPYTEEVVLVTEEFEKDILVALSQVFTGIQSWVQETECEFDNKVVEEFTYNGESTSGSYPNPDDDSCMMKIVADLVILLAINSNYIQHMVSNVLVVFSEFVAETGRDWDIFVQLLPSCMALVMTTKIFPSSISTVSVIQDFDKDLTNFYDVIKPKMQNANLSMVAGIIRVLRNQLKSLKKKESNDLIGVFTHYLHFYLSNVPWTLCDEVFVGNIVNTTKRYCPGNADGLFYSNVRRLLEPRIVFLGNFVQLLCSLVGQTEYWEGEAGSLNHNSAFTEIIDLVPSLWNWCHDKQGVGVDTCLCQYFRHKLLVLMIRLSSQSLLECSTLVLWLELPQIYLHKLVWQPMNSIESGQDDSIEDSPFLLTDTDREIGNLNSSHLQRLFIFLFLKCSRSLITGNHCLRATPKSCLSSKKNLNVNYNGHGCDCREKGLLQLFKWIQRQLPIDMFSEHEMYTDNCIQFASSFLQLYMREDDLLFKVLLQLLNIPFCVPPRFNEGGCKYHDEEETILFHISNLFNPINLFHIFLAELHYDHQVLLDYLISKDSGISCLEYIVRCLRIIINSFQSFAEFPFNLNGVSQSSLKKRKVLLDSYVVRAITSSKENKETRESDHRPYTTTRKPFKKATKCLRLLKKSVKNLHKKNIFAYNPEVLLDRLTRFLELSVKEEK